MSASNTPSKLGVDAHICIVPWETLVRLGRR